MANIITLKYGSGVPAQNDLTPGEVALDVTNKVIYSMDAYNNVIEMGRNMGEGGSIGWDQIDPDTIPEAINIIINPLNPDYVDLKALEKRVDDAEGDIAALEAWETVAKQQIADLQAQQAINTGNIDKNTTDIGKNTTAIGGAVTRLDAVEPKVEKNIQDIKDLQDQLGQDLTGLQPAGTYNAAINKVKTVLAAGTAAGIEVGDSLVSHLGDDYVGLYFIVDEPGELANTGTPARADGEQANTGDWLLSDGPHWVHFEFGSAGVTFSEIAGSPYDNAALEAALDSKMDADAIIDGGTYVGA